MNSIDLASLLVLWIFISLCAACQEEEAVQQDVCEAAFSERLYSSAECLHDPECPFVFISAHRAKCSELPENTLAAINLCVEAGVPMLELDTRMTSDGHVVIMHDDTVTRTTDGEIRFPDRPKTDQLTLAEFQQLGISDYSCDLDNNNGDDQPELCHPPSWRQVLNATRASGTVIFVDLKNASAEAVVREALIDGDQDRIIIFSGNRSELMAAKSVSPEVAVMPRVHSTDELLDLLEESELELTWVHGDPGFVTESEPVLRERGIRMYVNTFLVADHYLFGWSLDRSQEDLKVSAWEALDDIIEEGADGFGTQFGHLYQEYLYPCGFAANTSLL